MHEDVDSTKLRNCPSDCVLHLRFICHFYRPRKHLPSCTCRETLGSLFSAFEVAVCNDNIGACLGESNGELLAQAARTTGDEGNFIGQAEKLLEDGWVRLRE